MVCLGHSRAGLQWSSWEGRAYLHSYVSGQEPGVNSHLSSYLVPAGLQKQASQTQNASLLSRKSWLVKGVLDKIAGFGYTPSELELDKSLEIR